MSDTHAFSTARGRHAWPRVSVVMPVRNEERYLEDAVTGVMGQHYDGPMELVVAVGPSTDRTVEIARRLADGDPRIMIVDNPTGRTPAGLNAALQAATGEVVVRVDGHSALPEGYVRRAVEVLLETGADNVGGMMVPEGRTPFERAVARAMSSRVGIGGARFHVGGEAGPVETVYLGVFRREALDRLGGFDEHFVRAQDWELNWRIRSTGGTVWFDPALKVTYRPRSSLQALATQFYRTGQWRRQVVDRYPATASPRYLAAPAMVVTVGTSTAAAGLAALARRRGARIGLLPLALYLLGVLAGTAVEGRGMSPRERAWLLVVVPVMHVTWGAGFVRGARGG